MAFDPNDWEPTVMTAPEPTQDTPEYIKWPDSSYSAGGKGMDPAFSADLGLLAQDFYNIYGRPLRLDSAYRPTWRQAEIYASGVRPAARPGHSRHERGAAVDIYEKDLADLMKLPIADYGFETLAKINDPRHLQYAGNYSAADKERLAGKVAAGETPPEVAEVEKEAAFNPDDWKPSDSSIDDFKPTEEVAQKAPGRPGTQIGPLEFGKGGGPLEHRAKEMQRLTGVGEAPFIPNVGGIFQMGAQERLEAEKYGLWSSMSQFSDKFLGNAVDLFGKLLDTIGPVANEAGLPIIERPKEEPLSDAAGFTEAAVAKQYPYLAPAMRGKPLPPDYSAEKLVKPLSDYFREQARKMAPTGKEPETFEEKVAAGIGTFPMMLMKYGIATSVFGPAVGMAAVDTIEASDQPPMNVVEAAVTGLITGKVLAGVQPLTVPARMATVGGMFGFLSWLKGGDATDITSSTALGAGLALTGGKGNVTAREAIGDAFTDFKKQYEKLTPKEQTEGWEAVRPDKVQQERFEEGIREGAFRKATPEELARDVEPPMGVVSKAEASKEMPPGEIATAKGVDTTVPEPEPAPEPMKLWYPLNEQQQEVVGAIQEEAAALSGKAPESGLSDEAMRAFVGQEATRMGAPGGPDPLGPRPPYTLYSGGPDTKRLVEAVINFSDGQIIAPGEVIDQFQHAGVKWYKVRLDKPVGAANQTIFKVPEMNINPLNTIEGARQALAKSKGIDPSKLDYIGDQKGFRETPGLHMFNVLDESGKPITTLSWPMKLLSGGSDTAEFFKKYVPIWRSRMNEFLGAKLPGKGSGGGLANIIQGWASKGEFKPDELKWSGLIPWLQEKKGTVTKQDVVDYLNSPEHRVEIEEVWKGDKVEPLTELPKDYRIEVEKGTHENWRQVVDSSGNVIVKVIAENNTDADVRFLALKVLNDRPPTKFSQYVLPGGENYREVLLRMPGRTVSFDEYRKAIIDSGQLTAEEFDANKTHWVKGYETDRYHLPTEERFTAGHWEEPNVFSHVRVNDRLGPNGEKILFIEELQSDWALEGRKRGFQTEKPSIPRDWRFTKYGDDWYIVDANEDTVTSDRFKTEAEARAYAQELVERQNIRGGEGVPEFPFSRNWHEVTLKRMLRYAAENGYDQLAWTTGEQQAERYDLSKLVDKIDWFRNKDGNYDLGIITKDGATDIKNLTAKQVEDHIGKEPAAKIVNSPEIGGSLEGEGLKIGGEWAYHLYDQMVPQFLNKYGKQWGARVGEIGVETGPKNLDAAALNRELGDLERAIVDYEKLFSQETDSGLRRYYSDKLDNDLYPERLRLESLIERARKDVMESIHSLPITPSMKQSVLYEGQYMFAGAPDTSEWFKNVWNHVKESRAVRGTSIEFTDIEAGAKKLWDKLRGEPEPWTDYKRLSSRYLGDMQLAGMANERMIRALNKAVPDKHRQEAITNYIEAGGDPQLLKARADATKDPVLKRGYEAALDLNEKELDVAREAVAFYDKMLKEGQAAGILESALSNYINHVWKKDSQTARRLRGEINSGLLNTNFSYARKRIWSTYFDGEQAGRIPKNKSVSYLMGNYFRSFNEAVAARQAIRSLTEGKTADGMPIVTTVGGGDPVPKMMPEESRAFEDVPPDYDMTGKPQGPDAYLIKPHKLTSEQAANYRYIDHPALRKWKWIGNDMDGNPMLMQGDLWVHKDHYNHLKNMLGRSAIREHWLGGPVMQAVQTLKGTLLTGTPFHQVNVATHGLMHLVNIMDLPEIDLNNPLQQELIRHNLMIYSHRGMEEFGEGVYSTGLVNKVPGIGQLVEGYGKYLFQGYIPRLKMKLATEAFERNLKRYSHKYDRDQILELSANQANAAFGELNLKALGRNPTLQDVFRLMALAPDFLEARLRFIGQAFRPGGKEQAYALMRGALGLYAAGVIGNMLFSDDHSAHYDKPFQLVLGKKQYSLRSIPGDVLHAFKDPRNFIYWRLSPTTVRTMMEMTSGRDMYGRKRDFAQQVEDFFVTHMPIPMQPLLPGQKREVDLLDGALRTIGVSTSRYRTSADQAMLDYFMEARIDRPARSEFEMVQKARRKVLELARSGKNDEAVELIKKTGEKYKLDPKKALNWLMEAQYPENVANFRRLPLEVAARVINLAEPEEEQAFVPILLDKIGRANPDKLNLAMPQLEEYIKKLEERKRRNSYVEPSAAPVAPEVAPEEPPKRFSILNQ